MITFSRDFDDYDFDGFGKQPLWSKMAFDQFSDSVFKAEQEYDSLNNPSWQETGKKSILPKIGEKTCVLRLSSFFDFLNGRKPPKTS